MKNNELGGFLEIKNPFYNFIDAYFFERIFKIPQTMK